MGADGLVETLRAIPEAGLVAYVGHKESSVESSVDTATAGVMGELLPLWVCWWVWGNCWPVGLVVKKLSEHKLAPTEHCSFVITFNCGELLRVMPSSSLLPSRFHASFEIGK